MYSGLQRKLSAGIWYGGGEGVMGQLFLFNCSIMCTQFSNVRRFENYISTSEKDTNWLLAEFHAVIISMNVHL